MDELAREADLDDMRKDLETREPDLESELKDEIDPNGEITNSMRQLENGYLPALKTTRTSQLLKRILRQIRNRKTCSAFVDGRKRRRSKNAAT